MGIIVTKIVECDYPECKNMLKLDPNALQEIHALKKEGWDIVDLTDAELKTLCPEHKKEGL